MALQAASLEMRKQFHSLILCNCFYEVIAAFCPQFCPQIQAGSLRNGSTGCFRGGDEGELNSWSRFFDPFLPPHYCLLDGSRPAPHLQRTKFLLSAAF